MTDITMCLNKECPKRSFCYRAVALEDSVLQSWAHFSFVDDECEYFWALDY